MNEDEAARLVLAEGAPDQRLQIFAALLTSESGLGTEGVMVLDRPRGNADGRRMVRYTTSAVRFP
jgi:hypothetical protein